MRHESASRSAGLLGGYLALNLRNSAEGESVSIRRHIVYLSLNPHFLARQSPCRDQQYGSCRVKRYCVSMENGRFEFTECWNPQHR